MTGTNDFGAVACIHRRDNSFTFIISTAHGIVFIKRPGSSTIFKERLDCEHAAGVCHRGQVPIDYLIERLGTVEHIAHIGNPRCVPLCQRLIECIRIPKHVPHSSNSGCVPRCQGLVEIACTVKHSDHVSDARSIPPCQGLIEVRVLKHKPHILYFGSIPTRYIPLEPIGIAEHSPHSCYTGRIPTGNILVEIISLVEHVTHICYAGRIPTRNIPIEL